MTIKTMETRYKALVIFRDLHHDDVVNSFFQMLSAREQSGAIMVEAIASFVAKLFESNTSWTGYLKDSVLENENFYARSRARGISHPTLDNCLKQELSFLQEVSQVTLEDYLIGTTSDYSYLPQWDTEDADFITSYEKRLAVAGQKGYGIFAKYHVFTVEDCKLIPVRHPDPQRLDQLPGYENERSKIILNTQALLTGKPTNNVLLYGDAGTGKSSAIKGIANEFKDQGLRLVEVKKKQLFQIPNLVEQLAANPLKFILFIDDLSFTANDDNFAALKAILEGSVCGRTDNIAVYATSNRRHLIKETMSDRTGDDIHESDTRQELMSLAARFGLTITFQKPEKMRYQSIVAALAEQYGVEREESLLMRQAEAFAIRAGGRSPRVAKQFIELCKAGVQ
ncbi:MAG: ATP-binding protein [Eubacteriales bacterium]